jgi:hypothetical protein
VSSSGCEGDAHSGHSSASVKKAPAMAGRDDEDEDEDEDEDDEGVAAKEVGVAAEDEDAGVVAEVDEEATTGVGR